MASTKQTVSTDELSTFGARLRAAREEQDLSRPALAKLTDNIVTARIIDHLEKGTTEATIQKSELLAKALGVSTDWLNYGIEKNDTNKEDDHDVSGNFDEEFDAVEDGEPITSHHVDRLQELLSEIEACRANGFVLHSRKMPLLIEDAEIAIEYLELDEIEELALERCSSGFIMPEYTQPKTESNQSFRNRTRHARQEDAARSKFDKALLEITDRIIDTAVLGLDLYSVDLSVLSAFAKKHEISSPHFFGGWEHHSEIVPKVREKYRDMALLERISVNQSLLHT